MLLVGKISCLGFMGTILKRFGLAFWKARRRKSQVSRREELKLQSLSQVENHVATWLKHVCKLQRDLMQPQDPGHSAGKF